MAESDVPADQPKPPAHAETAIPPRRSMGRIFAPLGILVSLFLLALTISWLIHENSTEETEVAESVLEPPRPPLKKTESAGTALEHLALGDQALQHHHYAKALSHFEDLLTVDRSAAPLVEYRIGLCLESLGQLQRSTRRVQQVHNRLDGALIDLRQPLGHGALLAANPATGPSASAALSLYL